MAGIVQVEQTLDPIVLQEVYRLRARVWGEFGTYAGTEWSDEHDEHALHWVVRLDGEIVASARLCVHDTLTQLPDSCVYSTVTSCVPSPIASLNRLVIEKRARGAGLSKELDQKRLAAAAQAACRSVIGYVSDVSGKARLRSLLRLGFSQISREGELVGPMGPATGLLLTL
jgi:predicted GNAT family N-acyltransferase